jgi:hypothetical protein
MLRAAHRHLSHRRLHGTGLYHQRRHDLASITLPTPSLTSSISGTASLLNHGCKRSSSTIPFLKSSSPSTPTTTTSSLPPISQSPLSSPSFSSTPPPPMASSSSSSPSSSSALPSGIQRTWDSPSTMIPQNGRHDEQKGGNEHENKKEPVKSSRWRWVMWGILVALSLPREQLTRGWGNLLFVIFFSSNKPNDWC